MSAATMKAVRLHAFGGPEVLVYEDAPRPELKVRIPIEAGQGFRGDAGRRSDLKPDTVPK